jgi:hypothetical protein
MYSTSVLIAFIFAVAIMLLVIYTRHYRDAFRVTLGTLGIGFLLFVASELFHFKLSVEIFFLIPVIIAVFIGFAYAYRKRLKQVYAISFF